MAPWLGQGTECNKWLIAKLLSLNNPSLQHITLFEGNLPQNDTEIERGRERKKERNKERKKERTKERKKERERASELDAKCYGNCRKQGTTG